ncbi:N-acyl homoserine lactonase family protein [Corallococcus terminator]
MTPFRPLLSSLFMLSLGACAHAPETPPTATAPAAKSSEVRLYALDCGRIEVHDMGFFADGSRPTGKRGTMSVPCFLVTHPQGALLWETGLDDAIANFPDGVPDPVGPRFHVKTTLGAQLTALGLKPADIRYVAISHLHADHSGNTNAFTASTWLLQRKELAWATATPTPPGVDATKFSAWRDAKVELLDGDRDVFGDGAVRLLSTPGHTPGHQSLQVRLARAGTYILSGDLCHLIENFEWDGVPGFNFSREETLASLTRVKALLKDTHGRFVIQHVPQDLATLPVFPAYLE